MASRAVPSTHTSVSTPVMTSTSAPLRSATSRKSPELKAEWVVLSHTRAGGTSSHKGSTSSSRARPICASVTDRQRS